MPTTILTPGAQIAAELGADRAGTTRTTTVELVGGPRCGAVEDITHAGAAPRTLHDAYHRIGRQVADSGAVRYGFRAPGR